MAVITLEHIGKIYGKKIDAVEEFNLEIKDGEFVVLVGPSGCGKSTTLRMIAGLEEITTGKLSMDGVCVNDKPARDRDIAMVFQNYALYPHMTVYENMAFGLKMKKQSKAQIDRAVKTTAALLNLTHLLSRKPKTLSGGERQRTAMGRAMVRNPKLFLMDEPLSNLDAKLRVQMRDEIAGLHKRLGTTVIYVTHDQVEAMTLGTRIVVMKDGKIQQVDTPEQLYRYPANQFVASFIGSPQMNFLEVAVTENGLMAGDQRMDLPGSFQLEAYRGQTMVLGIRPEDVIVGQAQFQCSVDRVEYLGAEKYLHVKLAGKSVIIRTGADIDIQGQVSFGFLSHKIHLFQKKTGDRLNPCLVK